MLNAMVLLTLIPHVRLLQWSTITAMDATVPLTLISYPPHLRRLQCTCVTYNLLCETMHETLIFAYALHMFAYYSYIGIWGEGRGGAH